MISAAGLLLSAATSSAAPPAEPLPSSIRLQEPRSGLSLGAFGGMVAVNSDHELYDPRGPHRQIRSPSAELGLRLSYLPWPPLGLEAEGALVPASLAEAGGEATLYALRVQAILRYPTTVLTPFVVLGAGVLGVESASAELGDDLDPAAHWGLGALLLLTEAFELRLDARHVISAALDPPGSGGNGVTSHFELLLGFGFVLSELTPDAREDGRIR